MSDYLECSALECIHNEEHHCTAYVIQVKGGATKQAEKTFCNTFAVKDTPIMMNAIQTTQTAYWGTGDGHQFEMAEPLAEYNSGPRITCTATKCCYNDDYLCVARRVEIAEPGNKAKNRTQCETFCVQ